MTRPELLKPGETFVMERGPVTTKQLVMYAGASGDFNRIHYDHPFAVEAGLGGVLVHGMLTMAFTASCTIEAFGQALRIVRLDARFTAPVRVGDVVKVTLTVTGKGRDTETTEAALLAEVKDRVVLKGSVEVTTVSTTTILDGG